MWREPGQNEGMRTVRCAADASKGGLRQMGSNVKGSAILAGMPVGRRAPKGKRRWYLVHAPGREQATCDKVRKVIPGELLEDAFVMRKERMRKRDGEWSTYTVPMYEDYFFVVTRDVNALDAELSKLSFPAKIAKGENSHFAPMAADAQAWYEKAMDSTHTIRTSTAVIVDGKLHIQDGPLVGQESRVVKVDRHHRDCVVEISDGIGNGRVEHTEYLPMEIPFKS